jgi:hypothetical protein
MHSSACFREWSDSDTARLLENTDAQILHDVARPVGGLHHREHSKAFTKLPESKAPLRGALKASHDHLPECGPRPSIVRCAILISATFNGSRLSGQRRPAIESAGRNICLSKAPPAVSVVREKIPAPKAVCYPPRGPTRPQCHVYPYRIRDAK